MDKDWKDLLETEQIPKYHNHNSIEPFRYLGYYMVYTTNQRNWILNRMLNTVNTAVKIYSTRQLSLRGRATVMNTLIMSKIWFALRLLQLTQEFFSKLRTIIYGFVWNNKHPLVSFDQLCLPLSKGGLGILSPTKQFLSLQIRHLRHLFSDSNASLLVQPLILHHMSIIEPEGSIPTIYFFIPELRQNSLNHPTSIIQALYKSFDQFQYKPDLSRLSVSNLLVLPLRYFFISIPEKHWLLKYPRFSARYFFVFDERLQKLRPKVLGKYESKPRLCRRLYKQLMETRSIQLQDFVWQHIMSDTVDSDDESMINGFQELQAWRRFKSVNFRFENDDALRKATLIIPSTSLKLFWSVPI